jgi:hypothetical protein
VKRNLWLFLLKLVSISLVLGFLWFWKLQDAYPHFLEPIAVPFFQWVGVKKWLLSWVIDHFTNIVPYIALVLASPGLLSNWKKTLAALLGGLAILIISHLLLSWLVYHYSAQYRFTKQFFRITFPFFLLSDALPLALWLLFYPRILPELFGFMKWGKKSGSEKPKENSTV